MSMHAKHFVILGYDFSRVRMEIMDDDWKWTDEGEKWTCYASRGNVQMFTDVNDGYGLYFGYVVDTRDEEDEDTLKVGMPELLEAKKKVDEAMKDLSLNFPDELPAFEMIILTEWV